MALNRLTLSFKRRKPKSANVTHTGSDVCKFVEAFGQCEPMIEIMETNDRDNGDKRHTSERVVAEVG
jgi:hypothetical protein